MIQAQVVSSAVTPAWHAQINSQSSTEVQHEEKRKQSAEASGRPWNGDNR